MPGGVNETSTFGGHAVCRAPLKMTEKLAMPAFRCQSSAGIGTAHPEGRKLANVQSSFILFKLKIMIKVEFS